MMSAFLTKKPPAKPKLPRVVVAALERRRMVEVTTMISRPPRQSAYVLGESKTGIAISITHTDAEAYLAWRRGFRTSAFFRAGIWLAVAAIAATIDALMGDHWRR